MAAVQYVKENNPKVVPPITSLKTQLNDIVQTMPETEGHLKLVIELTKAEQARMLLLTERLGIRHPDDLIRYCLAQVTWWVLSGPMSSSSIPSNNSVSLEGNQSNNDRSRGYQ